MSGRTAATLIMTAHLMVLGFTIGTLIGRSL
jgi:hypothetical protein